MFMRPEPRRCVIVADVRFYHMERQSLDQVLPQLIVKALQNGRRIVVKTGQSAEVERLNEHLWTFDPDSFIPHGSAKDGNESGQPVWITEKDENPNMADVLILTHGAADYSDGGFSMICDMLDGRDPEAVAAARGRWKLYKEQGHQVTYWQQGEKGWEKK